MGLFRRKTRYRLELPADPLTPGREFVATLHAERIQPDAQLKTVRATIRSWGKKETTGVRSEGLEATEVSAKLDWITHELAVDAAVQERQELKLALPIWAPVRSVGDHQLGDSPELELFMYASASLEIAALPFHHTLFAATDALGWTFARGRTWWVGGRKQPVVQQLSFKPGDDLEGGGFKVAEIVVTPVAQRAQAGVVSVTVQARKTGVGRFPIAELDRLTLDTNVDDFVARVRSGLAEQIATARKPDGGSIDGQFIEGVIRLLGA